MRKNTQKLYNEQKNTTYNLTLKIGCTTAKLYRYCKGSNEMIRIDKMPYSLLKEIAKLEEVDVETLYNKIKEYQEI